MTEDKMDVSYHMSGYLNVDVDGRVEKIYLKNFNSPTGGNQISGRIYSFSQNQRKAIIAKTENIIERYDTGDCPTLLHLLLNKIKEVGSEMQKDVIFEDKLEVAQIMREQTEKNGKQTEEEEVMLRGTDCLLVLRRFGTNLAQFDDGELVKVVITGDK